MKRLIRWFVSDYTLGWFAGGAYWSWGVSWKSVAVIAAVIVVGCGIQVLVEE